MSSPNAISVYTVPSTWIREDHFEAGEPYNRIVGLKDPSTNQRMWGEYTAPGDLNGSVNPQDAEELLLPTTPILSERLVSFFKRYRQRPSNPFANCHSFGRAMGGEPYHREPIDGVFRQGQPTDVLQLGQVGILGYRQPGVEIQLHTMVGLGEEQEDCLQVMAAFGYLGTRSIELTKAYHRNETVPSGIMQWPFPDGYGIYAQPLSKQEVAA